MIAIVDYGMGNLRSVANALSFLDAPHTVTSDPREIAAADRIVLPGVGAFGQAMSNLRELGLISLLEDQVMGESKPFLGICLGMQLLCRTSTEHGSHKGLGWIEADVIPLDVAERGLSLPHMGWNDIETCFDHALLAHLPLEEPNFYFVHSFHVVAEPQLVVAKCEYGAQLTAAVGTKNIFATQFHPEKSQDNGLQIFQNFMSWEPS